MERKSNIQLSLPNFTSRTVKIYNVNGFGSLQPLSNALSNSAIYRNIKMLDRMKRNVDDRKKSRYLDDVDSDRNDYIRDFYSLIAERFSSAGRFDMDKLTKDINGTSLPLYLKELINRQLDQTITYTFDNEDEFKIYVRDSIKSETFHVKHQKILTEDLERCKKHISELENKIRSMRNDDFINQDQMNSLLSTVNLLQTLINNTIPLRVTLSTKITRNMYHNLRVLNQIAEEFGINKF